MTNLKEQLAQAIAYCDSVDWEKANADWDKANADYYKAEADWEKVATGYNKAYAEIVRLKTLIKEGEVK